MPGPEYIQLVVSKDPFAPVENIAARCPARADGEKNVLCPQFKDCVLPTVIVTAKDRAEAVEFAEIASEIGEIRRCLAGKQYSFKDPVINYGENWADRRAENRSRRRHKG